MKKQVYVIKGVTMPEKKGKNKIKYHFVQEIRCQKCDVLALEPGPCIKCKNEVFNISLVAKVIE